MRRLPPLLLLAALPFSAHGYQLLGGHWPVEDGPVEYRVSAAGSDDIPDDSDTQAVQYAFRSWECVLCSNVQFRYMGDGPNEMANDGVSSVFWLENAPAWQQQVGADINGTLGVAQHYELDVYAESDIAFNGATHSWSTDEGASATDVESIALHEIGHFAGLGHACTDGSESDCLPPTEAVMAPSYPGGLFREPFQDDQDGLCAIYTEAKTECSGKKRLKEPCERDCDCENSLYCVPDGEGGRMCSRTCGEGRPSCPRGTGCAMGVDSQGSNGMCLRVAPETSRKVAGMLCSRDTECESGSCSLSQTLNKLVCVERCSDDEDCDTGFVCSDGACLLPRAASGVPCPKDKEEPPTGCPGCNAGGGGLGLWALALLLHRRRRVRH